MADPDAPTIPAARSARFLFRGQLLHAAAAVVLATVAWALAVPGFTGGSWLGLTAAGWFRATVGLCVLHQCYGWLAFRGQLGWGLFTRLFGRHDLTVHAALFTPLLLARPVVVLGAGLASPLTLALPRWAELGLGLALLVPAAYTGWSVRRYFGFERALGGDHFRERYRKLPLVEDGAFRWTPNAMYAFAFLGLWSLALLLGSHVALVCALFQHAFVWAHYVGTERPDFELVYGA
ncbi:methyltransferase [Salinilacihabitans rarus]|uniref:methyltransferase n=1 Tax=Salinilacihabitans rarus TaxID=2961596 RepID=UPI0020C835DA|nr:methyltransferase [Salinilacihabitans rarus]